MARGAGKAGGSGRKPEATAGEWRAILTRVNPDALRALKILAIERDTTLQSLAVEALNDLLSKHGKRPTVKTPAGKVRP
jgi:hypothetical protein